MRGFSKAIIAGNLTRDPEMRTTPNGANVCSFSVAVNRVYKDSNGKQQESVSFIDCSAWGRLAEVICQYAHKGTGVLVSGRLDQHSWEDKETKAKRSRTEIVVDDFAFTDSRNNNDGGNRAAAATSDTVDAPETVPEDIPEDVDLSEIPF